MLLVDYNDSTFMIIIPVLMQRQGKLDPDLV